MNQPTMNSRPMNQPELRDIHLPDVSLWWPPAYGWWIGLLLILLLAILLPWLRRWWRHKPLKRLSLRELQGIRSRVKQGQSDKIALNEVAGLLRRVTISYYGRTQNAATTGNEWMTQLHRLAPDTGFSPAQLELLTRNRYHAETAIDIESLLRACERWLRALPRNRDHVSA